jgi:hypothetical protein
MNRRSVALAAGTLALATLMAGCSSSPEKSPSAGRIEPAGTAGEGDRSIWRLSPAEPGGTPPAAERRDGAPDGEGEASPSEVGDSRVDADLLTIDPCSLLDAGTFGATAGDAGPLVPLEGGRACGVTNSADTTRAALSIIRSDGTSFFTPDQRDRSGPGTEPSEEPLGGARWLAGAPVPDSGLLVVPVARTGDRSAEPAFAELVVEVSDRSGLSEHDRRRLAVALARTAFGRLGRQPAEEEVR